MSKKNEELSKKEMILTKTLMVYTEENLNLKLTIEELQLELENAKKSKAAK